MKIVVALDSDAHFCVAHVTDRVQVWDILTRQIKDGDYWADLKCKIEDCPYSPWDLVWPGEWEKFLGECEQRATFEIREI